MTFNIGDTVNVLNTKMISGEIIFEGRAVIKKVINPAIDLCLVEFINDDLSGPVQRLLHPEAQTKDILEFVKDANLRQKRKD